MAGVKPMTVNFKKSMWQGGPSQLWSFICPLCRANRKVPFQPKLGGKWRVFQIALTALMFMVLTWRWFSWRGIASFVPLWTVFEVVYRLRMRAALGCDQCGFDPYLFAVDPERARQEIDAHWRRKFAEKGIPYPEPKKFPHSLRKQRASALDLNPEI